MAGTMTITMERRKRPVSANRGDPFDLADDTAYGHWRERKLLGYPTEPAALMIDVTDPRAPTRDERDAILRLCGKTNMAIYATRAGIGKEGTLALGHRFGLRRLDTPLCTDAEGVTEIQAVGDGRRAAYIPYSERPLSWHTDGYYNDTEKPVRGVLLHCERAARSGGETALLDPEIAYIRLRDENPRLVAALMRPDALTIPANIEGGREVRARQSGPVFSVIDGRPHMRFTARKRYAEWLDDPSTAEARAFLLDLLAGDEPFVFRHRLAPGQGLICNNVLHNRSGFEDSPEPDHARLFYRARFLDRVADPA